MGGESQVSNAKLAEETLDRERKRAMQLTCPTNDSAVRESLRQMGTPVTLFGEREMERRDRLIYLLAKKPDGEPVTKQEVKEESVKISAVQKTVFYTEGTADLLRARTDIAHYSLPRAARRLEAARRKLNDPDEDEDREIKLVLKSASKFSLDCSEIGDDRGLTGCSFSPDSNMLVTSSRTGLAKLWRVPDISKAGVLKGHTEWLTDVAFSPDGNSIATGSADREAILWDLEGNKKMSFRGHMGRLARIAFHPSGNYLGTASYDKTWRLWDVNTGAEVLLQEGHSRSLYGIAFQCDGSLVASCGRDALTRVWDLRTGRSIAALEGHVKPVLAVDFSPNGYHIATGGEDHTCKVWDLRRRPQHLLYTIPAHGNIISNLKYEPSDGHYLVTASFDNTAKIWSARDFKPVKTLSGHEGKLMSLDLSPDGQFIATVSHDRTVKLWSPKNTPDEPETEPEPEPETEPTPEPEPGLEMDLDAPDSGKQDTMDTESFMAQDTVDTVQADEQSQQQQENEMKEGMPGLDQMELN